MNKKMTRDELYLCTLLKLTGGDIEKRIGRYQVGQAIAQNNRSVDNIVQILVKTHFIERDDGEYIRITPHGIRLAEELLD